MGRRTGCGVAAAAVLGGGRFPKPGSGLRTASSASGDGGSGGSGAGSSAMPAGRGSGNPSAAAKADHAPTSAVWPAAPYRSAPSAGICMLSPLPLLGDDPPCDGNDPDRRLLDESGPPLAIPARAEASAAGIPGLYSAFRT